MKFAFKFSMPKWERPKPEAPYRPSPIISELENIDFVSLTAERRQDVLRRLKLACADIAEDRRRQPAILSDRIRLQKMWQDYFRIAQTTPPGDNQGESLSVSHYSTMEEEAPKPKALGAVMTMQEELVAAANFKIDLGGMEINDLDDMDDFGPSSIPRTAPPLPPQSSPASTNAKDHRDQAAASEKSEKKAAKRSAAEEELAEQMARIKAVQPMGLPPMAFPNETLSVTDASDPKSTETATLVISEVADTTPLSTGSAFEMPVFTTAGRTHEEELAEQMARIKAVQPMALPPMAFPTEPEIKSSDHGHEQNSIDVLVIEEVKDEQPAVSADHEHPSHDEPVVAKSPDEELAEQMARIKAVEPLSLPPIPQTAQEDDAASTAPIAMMEPASVLTINPVEPEVVASAVLSDVEAASETVTALTVDASADLDGFKPLALPTAKTEASSDPQPEISALQEAVTDQASEAVGPIPQAEVPTVQAAPNQQATDVDPVLVDAETKPASPKAKKSKKGALASLRSMLSSKSQAEEPSKVASEPAAVADIAPAASPSTDELPAELASELASELAADLAAMGPVDAIPAAEPLNQPREREVSATPSTKEWVNIKLLRPSVIRGLPLPDQVITIVPYSEAKRLEENGSAIILTKPRTPRGS